MSDTEKNLVKYIAQTFERAKNQHNAPNEADAELVSLIGGDYAINIDEYSFEEDFFSDITPETLGYNLVIATLSDLLATGAVPEHYLHSMVLQKNKNHFYYEKVLKGIHEALLLNNTTLLGGDTSTGDNWRYTGVALGKTQRKLKRSGAHNHDIIYSTGRFGAGNRQALIQMMLKEGKLELNEENMVLATPKFPSRLEESKIIAKYANCAIDSSDGMINSLRVIAENNPTLGMKIELCEELVEKESQIVSMVAKLPTSVFLFATLGEYELIFSIPDSKNSDFVKEMENSNFPIIKLGEMTHDPGIRVSGSKGDFLIGEDLPDPRAMETEEYIKRIVGYVMEKC